MARNLEPGTVRLHPDLTLRVGQDLLGKLAGSRTLRFWIELGKNAQIILTPQTGEQGWPVRYVNEKQKSPFVSIGAFLKMNGLSMDYLPVGQFRARKVGKKIVVDLNERV